VTTPADPCAADIDWRDYTIVIDARSPREYAEGHIPQAVNLPIVTNEQFAQVGTIYKDDPHRAYVIGAQHALRNIASHMEVLAARVGPRDRILVYCARGGKRSNSWAAPLRGIGFRTDVLAGGWKAYRNRVIELLATLPPRLTMRVLEGPTGSAKTRLLQALAARGEQVLDLEGLAAHRGSLLGSLEEAPQPTQKQFDAELADALLRLDPARPVWLEAESRKVGELHLPEALVQHMRSAPHVHIELPLDERVRLLREDYPHLAADPARVVALLEPLKAQVGKDELAEWTRLAQAGDVDGLVRRLVRNHYDPSYARAGRRAVEHGRAAPEGARLALASIDAPALAAAAAELVERFG